MHSIIVGSAYHFYMPTKIGGIPLSGYYVDGNTGMVEFRNVEGSVPYPYQKKDRESDRTIRSQSADMDLICPRLPKPHRYFLRTRLQRR